MAVKIQATETSQSGSIKSACEPCAPITNSPCGCTAQQSCNEPTCCPIKTRIKDCHVFRGLELERSFFFNTGECNPETAYYRTDCVTLNVRRRGCCKVLVQEQAYKQSINGAVWFRWSEAFKALSTGYYEADVYHANKSCSSICIYLAPCADRVETDEIIMLQDCGATTCLEVDQTPQDLPTSTGCTTC
jgi:hypothetical protein